MKITRLRVAELRRFRAPFEIAGLHDGLNVFTGPNEAGKSTLVRAIRAAFFERHKSSSVDDLQPYGDTAAAPEVELDFEIDGVAYRLSKRFLKRMRCDLQVATRRLEGVEAEDMLARLLGFQFALKGASREQHWGIPGLLWIEQGSSQQLREPVVHAADHLRQALDASLGEVAASGGDEVVAQVRKARDELLTSTGKPRAELLKAQDDAAALDAKVLALQQEVERYRSTVDQLRRLRDEHAADSAAPPWVALREKEAAAQEALRAAQSLQGELDRARERQRQAAGQSELLLRGLASAEQARQALADRQTALATAITRHEQAEAAEAQARQAQDAAEATWRSAREALNVARQEDTRRSLARQAAEARQRAAELAAQLQRAAAEGERAATLQAEAARLRIEPRELAALREQQRQLVELKIRQDAVATRLRFELQPGARVALDDEPLEGDAERLVVAPAVVELPGLGRLRIAPGGADLGELAQRQARLADEQQALLQRLGLASAAEAESRHAAHAQRQAEAEAADQACRLLAPQGLDALRADHAAARAREAEASEALAALPPETAAALPLAAAEQQHDGAREHADEAGRRLQTARQALAAAAGARHTAQQEHERQRAEVDDPQRQADLARQRSQLQDVQGQLATLDGELAAIAARIAAVRPELLAQDVQRFGASAREAEARHRERDRQIAQIEATVAAAGAAGLEEDLARALGERSQARRRAEELQHRAEALDHLLGKLEARRQALTRRLQAPLQKHLDRYLQLLFPGGRLEVDERLVPGALVRTGTRGPEAGDIETLSFGAREQMGVIARLAYADLLREAGRPTLILLDDALVHSDEDRLAQMKRVLFDAAQRHQVLLFTCHPDRWRDMGVAMRRLDGPAAG